MERPNSDRGFREELSEEGSMGQVRRKRQTSGRVFQVEKASMWFLPRLPGTLVHGCGTYTRCLTQRLLSASSMAA